jgi:broad specificity phosphatase PhoE
VTAAVQDARRQAIELGGDGAEAILVSHQLPIWATRLSAEGRPLWHDPRKRECTLTSVTSLVFADDGTLLRVDYSEPAAVLLPGASRTPGA